MRCLVFLCLVATSMAVPFMYAKEDDVYRLELVPVSSTVIPLEELEYTVGVKFNVPDSKGYKHKPGSGKPSDLITYGGRKTAKKNKATVKQLTKADFERF